MFLFVVLLVWVLLERCLRNQCCCFFSTAANAYYSLLVVITTPHASEFLNPVKRVDQSTFIPMMIQSTHVGLLKSKSCLFWQFKKLRKTNPINLKLFSDMVKRRGKDGFFFPCLPFHCWSSPIIISIDRYLAFNSYNNACRPILRWT